MFYHGAERLAQRLDVRDCQNLLIAIRVLFVDCLFSASPAMASAEQGIAGLLAHMSPPERIIMLFGT